MMQLTQHSAVLGVASAGEAVVMLDASHSARPHQRKIFELAQHVLGQLPGSVGRKLYFLGNSEPYDPAQLSTRSAQWLHENFGRTSLLGPVMRRLDPSAPTKIIVLGAGRIFDLDDWAEHPLFARLALVACGEPLQPSFSRSVRKWL